jgi:hypothetical protein
MWAREAWVKNSEFHDLSAQEVLDSVVQDVRRSRDGKLKPVVVFDLDSTLFHVAPRTHAILREWLELEASAHPESIRALAAFGANDLGYSLKDLWIKANLDSEMGPESEALKAARRFWQDRFFSHAYLRHDHVMPGAVEYVSHVFESGATVFYVTGRDTPSQGFGTLEQLAHHGFPVDERRTRIVLKPRRRLDDREYKSGVIRTSVKDRGALIANFENEPKNLVAMAEAEPKAKHIFVETVSSDHMAPAGIGLYKIPGFESYLK